MLGLKCLDRRRVAVCGAIGAAGREQLAKLLDRPVALAGHDLEEVDRRRLETPCTGIVIQRPRESQVLRRRPARVGLERLGETLVDFL